MFQAAYWKGPRIYWLCQAAGWCAFLILRFVAVLAYPEGLGASALLQVVTALAGLALTHTMRAWLLWRGWNRLEGKALVPRVIALTVVGALSWVGIIWPTLQWAAPATVQELGAPTAFLLQALSQSLFLAAWLGLYFGWQAFRRSQVAQLERLRLERALSEAELRALKAQVNPHFLFNSLNSLRALIDEDPDRARDAVTQLANLLRAALQAGSRETVALESELATVRAYLSLEKLRHEERLRYSIDVPRDALATLVPPMLVQTLVENAVKHGLRQSSSGTDIRILASLAGSTLTLSVTNSGTIAAATPVAADQSTGLGLKNARERLQLLCGRDASLTLEEPEPGLVAAEVRIPVSNRLPGGLSIRTKVGARSHTLSN